MAEEVKQNPSQGILDAHKNRLRILAELDNPNLTDDDRNALHSDLAEAEEAYAETVHKAKRSKIPPAKS